MATAKKATSKKTTTKKTTTKKPTTRKAPAKKPTTKKVTTKSVSAKKAAVKTPAKRSTTKTAPKKKSCGAKIVAIIIAIVALIAVATAGGVYIYQTINSVNLAGTYKLTGMEADGKDQSDSLSLLEGLGLSASLELNDDKTGTLHLFGEDEDLTYDKSNFTIDGKITDYTYKDDTIVFESDGTKLTFTKQNK